MASSPAPGPVYASGGTPGKGGVVARRLIRAPATPFAIAVDHTIERQQALQDIDITVRCAGQSDEILNANLVRQNGGYRIDSLPDECSFIEIGLEARAWSGRSAVNEEIEAIRGVRR